MAQPLDRDDADRLGDEDEPLDREGMRHELRLLIGANLERDKVGASRRAIRKKARVQLMIIDQVIRMLDWEPSEIRDWLDTLVSYMDLAGLMPGRPDEDEQPELFPTKDPTLQTAEDWRLRGYLAGITGKGEFGKPPEECPPDNVQDWMTGWNESQAKNAEKLRVVR